jgi:DNA-binding transcriptional LysR family regulator
MELRHLKYLIAINEETTFVKAAERLHLAQPALSRQIQQLEEELASSIFVRGRRGVSLTPAGAICLGTARSVVQKADAAIERARRASAGHAGECTVYVSPWALWSGFSARLVLHLAMTEPDIRISLEESGPRGHWGSVLEGRADIAVASRPRAAMSELHWEPLLDDIADIAIMSPTHRLASKKSIRLEELKNELLLLYDTTLLNYEDYDLEQAFETAGFVPVLRRSVLSPDAVVPMVIAGIGWSIHRRSLRGLIPNVAMIPIEGFELHFPVTLVRKKGPVRPVVETVLNRIRELAAADYPDIYVAPAKQPRATSSAKRHTPTAQKLELRDLRYFVTAVDEQSIGRAAIKLGISQPALSRQLRDLDLDVGVKLLERSARGVSLTAAGESFVGDARDILAETEHLPSELARGERGLTGHCTIAAVPSAEVRDIISRILQIGAVSYPDVELHIQNIPTPLQPPAIQSAALDIGICHSFPGLISGFPDVNCRHLLKDSIDSVLLPIGHRLATRDSVELSELASEPFLFFRREFHPAFHDYLMDLFRSRNFHPVLGPMQEGLQTMWAMIAAGQGWSLGFGRQRDDPPPGIVVVPVNRISIPWGVVILTRRDESRPVTLAVIDLVSRAVHALSFPHDGRKRTT